MTAWPRAKPFLMERAVRSMANTAINLLFGVLGSDTLTAGSGREIKSGLESIVTLINKDPLKIKLAPDTDSITRNTWGKQIQSRLDALSASSKFSIQISQLTLSDGVLADFKKKVGAIAGSSKLNLGATVDLSTGGLGKTKSAISNIGDEASTSREELVKLKAQLEVLDRLKSQIGSALSSLHLSNLTDSELNSTIKLTDWFADFAARVDAVKKDNDTFTESVMRQREALIDHGSTIKDWVDGLAQSTEAEQAATAEAEALKDAVVEQKIQLAPLNKLFSEVSNRVASLGKIGLTGDDAGTISDLTDRCANLAVRIDDVNRSREMSSDEVKRHRDELLREVSAMREEVTALDGRARAVDANAASEDRRAKSLDRGIKLLTKMRKLLKNSNAAATGSTKGDYDNIAKAADGLQDWINDLRSGTKSVDEFDAHLRG